MPHQNQARRTNAPDRPSIIIPLRRLPDGLFNRVRIYASLSLSVVAYVSYRLRPRFQCLPRLFLRTSPFIAMRTNRLSKRLPPFPSYGASDRNMALILLGFDMDRLGYACVEPRPGWLCNSQRGFPCCARLLYSVCSTIGWISRFPHAQRDSRCEDRLGFGNLCGHLDKSGRWIRQQSGSKRTCNGFGGIELRSTGDSQAASV